MTDLDLATEHALALAAWFDREPDLNAHHCCFCSDFVAPGDRIACTEHRARINAEPMPWDEPARRPAHPGGGEE